MSRIGEAALGALFLGLLALFLLWKWNLQTEGRSWWLLVEDPRRRYRLMLLGVVFTIMICAFVQGIRSS